MPTEATKPSRWDEPFDINMTESDVDRILSIAVFLNIDAKRFPAHLPLAGIIKNDTRIMRYRKGDVVVLEGDYGSSAFFIMKGAVRVLHEADAEKIPGINVSRTTAEPKSWFDAVSQLWTNSRIPGYRAAVKSYADSADIGIRQVGDSARLFLQDVPGVIGEHDMDEIGEGEFFGEIAALGRTPRTATIVACEENTELLEIKWQGLRELRTFTPTIKAHTDLLYRERSLLAHLRETPIFAHLTDEELGRVAAETQFQSFGAFDWHGSYKKLTERSAMNRFDDETVIVSEGTYPNHLILVRSGFARLSEKTGNGHRTISYLGRGRELGFREIFQNWKKKDSVAYQFTMRSVGYVDLLFVPTRTIEEVVLPHLPKEREPHYTTKLKGSQYPPALGKDPVQIPGGILEFLVENRVINGSATMLIDMDRCTRCDDCVRACATTHDGNPRFKREGKHVDHYMVANACMHCQDPICMIGCPTGAINRNLATGQILINEPTCIGCATCAESCPYDNITMELIRDAKNEIVVDTGSQKPIMKATKCDLCHEQLGGPACERACPHSALIRIDMMQQKSTLAQWFNRG